MAFDERLRNPHVDRLFQAMQTLKGTEEYYRFFEDLCTVTEIRTLAQRFRAAEMLQDGAKYEEVVEETGMSSATISRIKRFLNYGADGYTMAIERLSAEEEDDASFAAERSE
ncbi:MAG: YerC/YecD family TrpR-related protein [Bacillota bacterium]